MNILALAILVFLESVAVNAQGGFYFPDAIVKRLSVTKCEEYKDLVANYTTRFRCQMWRSRDRSCYSQVKFYQCAHTGGLVVGGEKSNPGEFPHMAAIGWKTNDGNIEFACGGSLISERFVLTVAHCSKNSEGKSPSVVRLGDQNLATQEDEAEPKEYDVEKFIPHPKYLRSSKKNDIALIKLRENVVFTKFIRPGCLQQDGNFNRTVVATGWGQIGTYSDTSKDLLKVKLKVVENDDCERIHAGDYDIYSSQVCAGGEKGKDTCRGDSGGPIQVAHLDAPCVYNVVGLTSYGSFVCGAEVPSMYTRVSSYLDWIEKIVWS